MGKIGKTDREFQQLTSRWTLTFHDPEEEAKYLAYVDTSLPVPLLFKIMTVIAIMVHILYRIYALIVVSTTKEFITASFERELGGLVCVLSSLLIEAVCRYNDWFKAFHGFVIYTCLPIVSIEVAFGTEKYPGFDVAYLRDRPLRRSTFALLGTQGTVAVFIQNWKAACLGNLVISVVATILLFQSYGHLLEPRILSW